MKIDIDEIKKIIDGVGMATQKYGNNIVLILMLLMTIITILCCKKCVNTLKDLLIWAAVCFVEVAIIFFLLIYRPLPQPSVLPEPEQNILNQDQIINSISQDISNNKFADLKQKMLSQDKDIKRLNQDIKNYKGYIIELKQEILSRDKIIESQSRDLDGYEILFNN